MMRFKMNPFTIPLRYARRNARAAGGCAFCPGVCGVHHPDPVIPGWSEGPDPESRDSPMCNRTSEVRRFASPRNDGGQETGSRGSADIGRSGTRLNPRERDCISPINAFLTLTDVTKW